MPVVSIGNTKVRVAVYQNLRKTYPRCRCLSFANARKTVDFAILVYGVYSYITMTYGVKRSNMGC